MIMIRIEMSYGYYLTITAELRISGKGWGDSAF